MADNNKDQKTEEPTSKRITDTEKKGNFAHSKEINSSFILLAALLGFMILGEQSTRNVMGSWTDMFAESWTLQLTPEELYKVAANTMQAFVKIVGPFLIIIMLAGVMSNLLQIGGLRFSSHPLVPKFNKLNPLAGFGRIFSKNSVMELFKSLFKVGIISVISYYVIKSHWKEIPPLMGFGVGQVLSFMGFVALEIIFNVLLVMIFLSLLDFTFQKFTYLENLRMTKQEIKEERKESDGNPQVKQRIRTVQMQMARKRMMSAVPEADVIVTNPTHISIAIKYDTENFAAPLVVAKGVGPIAMRIREIAKENGIPLVEDKPLARTLNKTVEVGQMIPASLYKAVAEILAYVYKLKHSF
ncbi:MAG: flagellar biosynthesis protein FlhB [Nitrospina sp.]|nr:flagellar biosynthesis protein FlhB [Nitrospina sp.]|tara:strand:+ start:2031 stop:3098 length:1068 start_codon:yes stop_codon:yes gene_type:complete